MALKVTNKKQMGKWLQINRPVYRSLNTERIFKPLAFTE